MVARVNARRTLHQGRGLGVTLPGLSHRTQTVIRERVRKGKKIAFLGHFDCTNFGNESSLQAVLYHLRRRQPDADITCISTSPEATVATHHIKAIPLSQKYFRSWMRRNRLQRALRMVLIALPSEVYRWINGIVALRRTDMLIIPGTGLLTDAYGLLGWGPYNMFRWSLIAKTCRCKLLIVSVGAGPIFSMPGRWLVRSILSLADYRSYRDRASMAYLENIGFRADKDRIFPDLAFSLPEPAIADRCVTKGRRPVVGLGVMCDAGKYSSGSPSNKIYAAYLECLVAVVRWLLDRGYDVRLISGDLSDIAAKQEFRDLLKAQLRGADEERIIDEPIYSVEDLLVQILATDLVVATRFHNIIFALLCKKSVISVSFHHKCASLMSAMGLSDYCLDINDLRADRFIEKFSNLEANSAAIERLIREKVDGFRDDLDEQYDLIFNAMN
jgi:polysaccharide pyruvyl transferase WcaK-like protein